MLQNHSHEFGATNMGLIELLLGVVFMAGLGAGLGLGAMGDAGEKEFLVAKTSFLVAAVAATAAFWVWWRETDRTTWQIISIGALAGVWIFIIFPLQLQWLASRRIKINGADLPHVAPVEAPEPLAAGSLRYVVFKSEFMRKASTGTNSIKMWVVLQNTTSKLVYFHANLVGDAGGKTSQTGIVEFDGSIPAGDSRNLIYDTIFDIPINIETDVRIPSINGKLRYDVSYWIENNSNKIVRRTARDVEFSVWHVFSKKPAIVHLIGPKPYRDMFMCFCGRLCWRPFYLGHAL
jgi:hypothetical protein